MEDFKSLDPPQTPYWNSDQRSFAYTSVKDRWPVILTTVIDDARRSVDEARDDLRISEGKRIIEHVAKLKYDIQHDRPIQPIQEDDSRVTRQFNAELSSLRNPSWYNAPWLFSECFLYHSMHVLFNSTEQWRAYDPFERQKQSTLEQSESAVRELTERLCGSLLKEAPSFSSMNEDAQRLLFDEMLQICLWGNATDLSLLTSITYEDIQRLQGSQAVKKSQANIICNDTDSLWRYLSGSTKERIDIVLDNSGFELFVDLVLAVFLLEFGFSETVVLHPKDIPWFVSDALPKDIASLFTNLNKTFPGERMDELSDLLAHHHSEGKLIIRPNPFWTTAHNLWRMEKLEPNLFDDLKSSGLVVFKGDLNYRKMTGDCEWPRTTDWQTAIGPLRQVNCLALRTCKADVCVGLQEGQEQELDRKDSKWDRNGKFAVIMFNQKSR